MNIMLIAIILLLLIGTGVLVWYMVYKPGSTTTKMFNSFKSMMPSSSRSSSSFSMGNNKSSECKSCSGASFTPQTFNRTVYQEEPLPDITEGEEVTQHKLIDMSFRNPIPNMMTTLYSDKRALGNYILGDLDIKPRTTGPWIPYDTNSERLHRGILQQQQ